MQTQKKNVTLNLIVTFVLMLALVFPASIALAQDDAESTPPLEEEGTGSTDDSDLCFDENGAPIDCPADDGSDGTDATDGEEQISDDNDEKPIPPGQMVRRGLSGPIAGVGDGYILIETNFGLVKVVVDAEVDESMIGQRVAVKLAKTEGGASGFARGRTSDDEAGDTGDTGESGTDGTGDTSSDTEGTVDETTGSGDDTEGTVDETTDSDGDADDTGDAGDDTGDTSDDEVSETEPEFYREAVAEQFKLIPSKAKKQHQWGTIEATETGGCALVTDGSSIPAECGASDEGEDVVGLVDDDETGDGDEEPTLLGIESTSKIQARITARLALAEEEGDVKVMERLQTRLDRYEINLAERQQKAGVRAAARAEKANQSSGKGGGKDKDKGNSANQGQGSSGNQGNSGNQGGGNSGGNSGGGGGGGGGKK